MPKTRHDLTTFHSRTWVSMGHLDNVYCHYSVLAVFEHILRLVTLPSLLVFLSLPAFFRALYITTFTGTVFLRSCSLFRYTLPSYCISPPTYIFTGSRTFAPTPLDRQSSGCTHLLRFPFTHQMVF
jgi:hypothetical protein